MKKQSFFVLFFLSTVVLSCRKPDEFPIEPVITYKSIYSTQNAFGYDEKMTVLLDFTDGDGDVGYRPVGQNDPIYDDPNSPYYDNYVATLFQLSNNVWTVYPTVLPLGGRVPYLTPLGKIKTLKGEIACDFDVPPASISDTFRLEVFIYDRSFHKSNTITTSAVILNTQ